ncbi:hypothetical protein CL618_03285 [archaeon]|nr:hypothetical protein [archaeon]|tara:strand:- start:2444 stop:3415 length:972 start_codon:yes stop_codon:yes gene_type:complete
MKYGIISDIHRIPVSSVEIAKDMLMEQGVDKLILNGDVGDRKESIPASQNHLGSILTIVGESGLETFVQPGSHETLLAFGPVIDHFSDTYPMIDTTKDPKSEQPDHDLVFLLGSDFLCGGEYEMGNEIPSGRYIKTEKGLLQFETLDQYMHAIQQGYRQGAMQYANMQDLRDLVTDPDKTVVVCHVPRKFDNLETAVDVAEFGEATEDFKLGEQEIQKSSIFPGPVAEQVIQAGYPVTLKRENRGNEELRDLYTELGITKAVTGHFHESFHRAHDLNCNPLPQRQLTDELFWNASCLDLGAIGILTVEDNKVAYENLKLHEHL